MLGCNVADTRRWLLGLASECANDGPRERIDGAKDSAGRRDVGQFHFEEATDRDPLWNSVHGWRTTEKGAKEGTKNDVRKASGDRRGRAKESPSA